LNNETKPWVGNGRGGAMPLRQTLTMMELNGDTRRRLEDRSYRNNNIYRAAFLRARAIEYQFEPTPLPVLDKTVRRLSVTDKDIRNPFLFFYSWNERHHNKTSTCEACFRRVFINLTIGEKRCVIGGGLATQGDHIIPRCWFRAADMRLMASHTGSVSTKLDFNDALDPDDPLNLRPLCRAHNKARGPKHRSLAFLSDDELRAIACG
jgi:hypothetical protein